MDPYCKRAVAIHDISCAGRCSLTVALPVLSVQGIETNVIPTAILSTQTGGFEGYTYHDLTHEILPVAQHWKKLNRKFDAIYTGFLGSYAQLEIVSKVIEELRDAHTLVYIDPVMADGGELYKTFDRTFVDGMRNFCKKADVITPNITEAFLLLNRSYREGPYTDAFVREILYALAELGPDTIVLTGVYPDETHLGAAVYDKKSGEIYTAYAETVSGTFHGAGDLFAGVFLGKMLRKVPVHDALRQTVGFTAACIQRTGVSGADTRFGLNFEPLLGRLAPDEFSI